MRDYKTWPQVLIAIAANGGSFLYGISLGWSSPSGPEILSSNNDFVMSEMEFSWAVSLMPLGGAFSSVLSGIIRNRIGTKKTILMFAFPHFLGWLSIAFALNPSMIMIGRFLIGVAGGAYCFNIPVFIGEIASKEIRGFLLTLFQVFVNLGIVFVYILGSFVNLFVLNVICASLVLLYTTCCMFFIESPIFLVRNGEFVKAEKSIKLLRGTKFNAQMEMSDYQKHLEEASKASQSSFFIELKKKETLKAFFIIICVFIFFQMSGINCVIFYTNSIFIEAGIVMSPSIASITLGIVQVLSTLSTIGFVDKFGRVFLLKISFTMIIVGLMGIGIFFHLKSSEFEWLPLPSLCIFVIGFSAGMGSIPFVLLGEIFSDEAKKVIAPFAQTMNFVMSSIIGLLYPALVNSIGISSTFFMFVGFSFIGLIFTILVIPETKGKSLEEIQDLLMS